MKKGQLFLRLLRYAGRYSPGLIGLILIALLGVGFEVIKPLPLKVIIDSVIGHKPMPVSVRQLLGGAAWLSDKSSLLAFSLAVIVISALGNAVISFLVTGYTARLCQRLVHDLSIDLYSKLQQLSLAFYARNKVGDLLQRLSNDVFVVYFLVAQIIVPAITSVVCLAAMFYVMVSINLTLALIALSVVPLLAISLAVFSKPMEVTTDQQYEKFGDFSAFVQQSLSAMKIIQAFARERFMRQKVEAIAFDYNKAFLKATRVSAGYNQVSTLITGLVAAVLIGMGAKMGIEGTVSVGDLYVFLGYITALSGPVNSLSMAIGTAVVISSRSKRLFDILDSEEMLTEVPPSTVRPAKFVGDVEFDKVVFGYGNPDAVKPTLQEISIQILAGQTVAVVGPTGAGKTSLISLLSRFYDPWRGRILIDNEDIKNMPLDFLRENVAVVLQEPFLFPMTIAENISFGNLEVTQEDIQQAARTAQAHDFIMKLPQGYNTLVIESGLSLSGGEKQRISLARAFLKKSPILILDEPTSALDAFTEAHIFEALRQQASQKTIFIITHRLAAIKHADLIITIKDGHVVESGTHQALLAGESIYAQMYQHQQFA